MSVVANTVVDQALNLFTIGGGAMQIDRAELARRFPPQADGFLVHNSIWRSPHLRTPLGDIMLRVAPGCRLSRLRRRLRAGSISGQRPTSRSLLLESVAANDGVTRGRA